MVEVELIDHLGYTHNSIKEMTNYWGISKQIYQSRRASGLSVKESLTKKVDGSENIIKDHKNKQYDSIKSMAEAWGISEETYKFRRNKGLSVKESLTI